MVWDSFLCHFQDDVSCHMNQEVSLFGFFKAENTAYVECRAPKWSNRNDLGVLLGDLEKPTGYTMCGVLAWVSPSLAV